MSITEAFFDALSLSSEIQQRREKKLLHKDTDEMKVDEEIVTEARGAVLDA